MIKVKEKSQKIFREQQPVKTKSKKEYEEKEG